MKSKVYQGFITNSFDVAELFTLFSEYGVQYYPHHGETGVHMITIL